MWTDHYLRFGSEAEAISTVVSVAGYSPRFSRTHAVDYVGTVYDDNDEALPGYHVNVLVSGNLHASLQPFKVYPSTPSRRFS